MHSPAPQTSAFSPFRNLRISQATTIESAVDSPYRSQLSPFAAQDSPYKPRVKPVEKRFNATTTTSASRLHVPTTTSTSRLQNSLDTSSFLANSEQFEVKIRRLDEKIIDNYRQTDDKLRLFEQEVATLQENVAADTVANELVNERKEKELDLVEARITLELQNGKKQSKEAERQILENTEGKIDALKADFTHEYRKAEVAREKQTDEITNQISNLQNDIKEEVALRERTQNTLVSNLNQRLSKVREALASERKIRQKTEAFLFDKIEEINATLSNQVTNEVNTREEVESQMLRLLEETCSRYEDTVISTRRRY